MMWFGHGGFGLLRLGWMLGGGLLTVLFWGAVIALIVLALRSRHSHPVQHPTTSALEVLNTRYARGEITKAEYDQIRQDIGR